MSQQVNLFNPVFLKQKKVFTALAMAQAMVLLAGGLAALTVYSQRSVVALERQAAESADQLARRKARLEAATAELAPRKKSPLLESQLAAEEAKLTALRNAAAVIERGTLGNTKGYAEFFRAFARQNVSGLWLTGLSLSGAGDDLAIEGRALQAELVPAYIGRLSHEAALRGKTFGSLQISTPARIDDSAKNSVTLPPYIEFTLQAAPAEPAK